MNGNGPPNYPSRRGASRWPQEDVVTEGRVAGDAASAPGVAPPTPVLYVPGNNPVGGATVTILGGGAPLNVAKYSSPDGVARRITVVAYSPITNGLPIPDAPAKSFLGIAIRIGFGGARGGVRLWRGVPSITQLVASDCYVDAQVVLLPYNFGVQNPPGANPAFGPIPTGNGAGSGIITGLIYDSPFDEPPGDEITSNALANWTVLNNTTFNRGPNALGPVHVTACTLTNTSAASVTYGIFDGYNTGDSPGLIERPARDVLTVPAGTTAGIGRELLGPFFAGFSVAAITPATALSGPNYTVDATGGPLTQVCVRGYYLDRN